MKVSWQKRTILSVLLIIGCFFIGLGIGKLYNQDNVGEILGLGFGLVAAAVMIIAFEYN